MMPKEEQSDDALGKVLLAINASSSGNVRIKQEQSDAADGKAPLEMNSASDVRSEI